MSGTRKEPVGLRGIVPCILVQRYRKPVQDRLPDPVISHITAEPLSVRAPALTPFLWTVAPLRESRPHGLGDQWRRPANRKQIVLKLLFGSELDRFGSPRYYEHRVQQALILRLPGLPKSPGQASESDASGAQECRHFLLIPQGNDAEIGA